jgi:hypothetical protein
MTTQLLDKLGIKVIQVRNPRILEIPGVGEIKCSPGETIADIFEDVYELGFKAGIEKGKKQKVSEIRKCLNLNND